MISPHTPPGTKIACVRSTNGILVVGGIYTVIAIVASSQEPGLFLAQLAEVDHTSVPLRSGMRAHGWRLNRFQVATLPSCLTDCLTSAPIRTRKTVGAS